MILACTLALGGVPRPSEAAAPAIDPARIVVAPNGALYTNWPNSANFGNAKLEAAYQMKQFGEMLAVAREATEAASMEGDASFWAWVALAWANGEVDSFGRPTAKARAKFDEAMKDVATFKPGYQKDLRRVFDDKDVDGVIVATPNHWHALGAIWAIQAGKDVYVEKPLSMTVREGRRMVEVARETFSLTSSPSRGDTSWTLTATARYDRGRPIVTLNPVLVMAAGAGMMLVLA